MASGRDSGDIRTVTKREISAAVVGFVFGYVGWYSALRLVPTVAGDKPRLLTIALLSSLIGWVGLGALGAVGRHVAARQLNRGRR